MMRQENDLLRYLTARQEPRDRFDAARAELRRALEDGAPGRVMPHEKFLADQLGEPGVTPLVSGIVQHLAD